MDPLFFVSPIQSGSTKSTQAPATQFTSPEILRRVLSRPLFLLASLVIKPDACLEIFWLAKPVGAFFPPLPLCSPLLSARSFLPVDTLPFDLVVVLFVRFDFLRRPYARVFLLLLLLRRPLEEFQLWSYVSDACLLHAAFYHWSSPPPSLLFWCYSW